MFEVARHQELHAIPIEADQLPQEAGGQEVLALLLLLDDDLGQYRAGDVFAGLSVISYEIAAFFD